MNNLIKKELEEIKNPENIKIAFLESIKEIEMQEKKREIFK